jgi:AraC family transcriptional regulator
MSTKSLFPFLPKKCPGRTVGAGSGSVPASPADCIRPDYKRLTMTVVELLEDARALLDSDRQRANSYLARATELLRGGRHGTEAGSDGALPMPVRGGLAPWQTRRVMQRIGTSLASSIRMKDLADIAQLSESYFSRAFKASLGMSPHAYILRKRIERAQEIMLTSDEPLSQIALACGLCDQAHLSRLFRRVTGLSPGSWRRQRQRDPSSSAVLAPQDKPKAAWNEASFRQANLPNRRCDEAILESVA